MKTITGLITMVFLLAGTGVWAGIAQFAPDAPVTFLTEPTQGLFESFRLQVQAAVESGEEAGIRALYQTNGLTAQVLKSELAGWQRIVGQDGEQVSFWLKDLAKLPPESHRFWSAEARRLTEHEVSHFVCIQRGSHQLIVPVVIVDNRVLIVPSEKIAARGIEPGAPADGNQPFHSETNRTSGAAGSRR